MDKDELGPLDELQRLRGRIAKLEQQADKLGEDGRRLSEERFRLMADAAPVMMWMSGRDTLCNFFNKRWLTFRGRTMEQEQGNGWASGVHPDDLQYCLNTYLAAFHARQEFQMEYRLQRADGEYRWIVDTGVPRFEPDGSFAGYVGSGIDIHDRKLAEFGERAPADGKPLPAPASPLTEREVQVLVLIAEGKSTKEIAGDLGISYKTADSHRGKIMEKLGVHETASVVRYAIRAGLVRP